MNIGSNSRWKVAVSNCIKSVVKGVKKIGVKIKRSSNSFIQCMSCSHPSGFPDQEPLNHSNMYCNTEHAMPPKQTQITAPATGSLSPYLPDILHPDFTAGKRKKKEKEENDRNMALAVQEANRRLRIAQDISAEFRRNIALSYLLHCTEHDASCMFSAVIFLASSMRSYFEQMSVLLECTAQEVPARMAAATGTLSEVLMYLEARSTFKQLLTKCPEHVLLAAAGDSSEVSEATGQSVANSSAKEAGPVRKVTFSDPIELPEFPKGQIRPSFIVTWDDPEPEVSTQTVPEVVQQPAPVLAPEVQTESVPEIQTNTEIASAPEMQTEAEIAPEPESEAQTEPEPETQTNSEIQTEPVPEMQTQPAPEVVVHPTLEVTSLRDRNSRQMRMRRMSVINPQDLPTAEEIAAAQAAAAAHEASRKSISSPMARRYARISPEIAAKFNNDIVVEDHPLTLEVFAPPAPSPSVQTNTRNSQQMRNRRMSVINPQDIPTPEEVANSTRSAASKETRKQSRDATECEKRKGISFTGQIWQQTYPNEVADKPAAGLTASASSIFAKAESPAPAAEPANNTASEDLTTASSESQPAESSAAPAEKPVTAESASNAQLPASSNEQPPPLRKLREAMCFRIRTDREAKEELSERLLTIVQLQYMKNIKDTASVALRFVIDYTDNIYALLNGVEGSEIA